MKIDDFTLENWLNPACDSEKNKIYLGGSCVLPMTVEELFQLTGESMEDFFQELRHMDLGYGRFDGTPRTRRAIAEKLYRKVEPEEVILCHGGTGLCQGGTHVPLIVVCHCVLHIYNVVVCVI